MTIRKYLRKHPDSRKVTTWYEIQDEDGKLITRTLSQLVASFRIKYGLGQIYYNNATKTFMYMPWRHDFEIKFKCEGIAPWMWDY